jgi:multiple sugar transport system substrate-binding protein
MSRVRAVAALLVLVALGVAAVGATAATTRSSSPTKLTIWVGWSARELSVFSKVVHEYDQAHPDVQVKVVGGINDNKIVAAIRAGNAPDVVSSFNSYNVGTYCATGGWIDLAQHMKQSGVSASLFPAATQYYTQFAGKRCALPLLADDYGLYYNKALFASAGIKSPPKTIAELTADAKKLTKYNPDGSIKVLGIDPLIGFYENVPERWITSFGGKWLDSSQHSILAKNAAWTKWLTWQKQLVDSIGYKKLVRFQAGLGDEFSASNAFEAGKVAMNLDGEWRVAFIQAEHPKLAYGTAPMPVDASQPQLYGSGYINGTIIGIPKNGKHEDQAWALVRYLTTNTHALAELSNGLRNVPSTQASLTSKELIPDAHFATFLHIFGNAHSTTSPITAAGVSYTNSVQNFATKWQAGQVKSVSSGLSSLDKQLDAMVKQAKGGGGVP